MPARSIDWNDRQIATLKDMWARGVSSGVIAARLGCSRSAEMGKVRRLNLASRKTRTAAFGNEVRTVLVAMRPDVRAFVEAHYAAVARGRGAIKASLRSILREIESDGPGAALFSAADLALAEGAGLETVAVRIPGDIRDRLDGLYAQPNEVSVDLACSILIAQVARDDAAAHGEAIAGVG